MLRDPHAVTTSSALPAAWFRFYGTDRHAEGEIQTCLGEAGVQTSSLQEFPGKELHDRHGIVCFSDVDDELLSFLRHLRDETHALTIAVAAAAIRPGTTWRLLREGAAEVLVWEGAATAAQIRARLERWRAIDHLTEVATSRTSLAGESSVWRTLVRRVVDAARFTNSPILLTGETGTGKEVLARLIAMLDGRANVEDGPLTEPITVDCSTIVPELSGSELFGHERGAFTGAISAREGAFATAHGGTLFLDEIGELPLPLQTQLLRAIQEKKYKRVGGNAWQASDFRLVCATNRDLARLTEKGEFRLDLYHRIAGCVFRTVPLRERREDILPVARYFLKSALPAGMENLDFDLAVCEYLANRDYPGNVRELRHLVQRMAHRHVGPGAISAGDIPEEDRPEIDELPRAWPDEQFEKTIAQAIALGAGLKEITQVTTETAIRIAVQSEKGNLQRAASRLGVTDRALQLRRASGKIPG